MSFPTLRTTSASHNTHKRDGLYARSIGDVFSILQQIESFIEASKNLGQCIQAFVVKLTDLDNICRIIEVVDDPCQFYFEFFMEYVEGLKGQRRNLLLKLDAAEKESFRMRKRLRSEAGAETAPDGQEVSSLDLPVDRRTQIITVEHVIVQLSETRIGFKTCWIRFKQRLKNVYTLQQFEERYRKVSTTHSN